MKTQDENIKEALDKIEKLKNDESMKSEWKKCSESMSYFARNYGLIKTTHGTRKFTESELDLLQDIEDGKKIYIQKLRKHYK